jgi:hypothetical protein
VPRDDVTAPSRISVRPPCKEDDPVKSLAAALLVPVILLTACTAAGPVTEPVSGAPGDPAAGLPTIALYGGSAGGPAPQVDLSGLAASEGPLLSTAYRLELPGTLAALGGTLAARLGVQTTDPTTSEMQELEFSDDYASLYISTDGSWYYTARIDTAIYDCIVVPESGAGDEYGDCTLASVDPERVQTLAGQAVRMLDLDGLLGPFVPSAFEGSYAEAQLLVDGGPSGLWFGFGFAPDEQLAYAYGHLSRPVAVGDYPLLDAGDTARRLADSLAVWDVGGVDVIRPVAAAFELIPFLDVAGVWWLLPGYRFVLDDGQEWLEHAIAEQYLLRVQQDAVDDFPMTDPELERQSAALADRLLGLSEQVATEQLARSGTPWRITRRDDEWFAGTMDFVPHRLNIEVDDDVVTVITFG